LVTKRQITGSTGEIQVTTAISNDKILPADSNRTAASEKRAADRPESTQSTTNHSVAADQGESALETGSVDVERANQIYSQEQIHISSREEPDTNQIQARLLASDIGKQIEADAIQALKAQAGSVSISITALLETAPV
jgi:hypothetical protein